jgi:hypothetical protein
MKSKMNKNTGVRYADKKQPLLYWQIKKFNSRMIARIETPNPHFGKDNIPHNKENCSNYNGGKNCFPPFYVFHPFFETIKKRNKK